MQISTASGFRRLPEIGTDVEGGAIIYRLKQVDKDRAFSYSPIKKVSFSKNNSIVLVNNPVRGEAILKYVSTGKGKVQIRIIDQLGKLVLMQQVAVENGTNQIRLETNVLAKGVYEVELISNTGHARVRMMKE